MDRLEFASSINYANSSQEEVVGNHFDKLMSLYDMLTPICVHIVAFTNDELQFNISPVFNEDVESIIARLRNQRITNYGRVYNINTNVSDTGIIVELIEIK